MTDKAIWELTALTAPTTDDIILAVDSPSSGATTKKIAISDLRKIALNDVVLRVFTVGSGTYTPTANMRYALCIAVGGGGGGGGGINTASAGGGGGGGGTAIKLFSAATIGASKAYVVGAGGAASSDGTATTLDAAGALIKANQGYAGFAGSQAGVLGVRALGGDTDTATGGDLNFFGTPGQIGFTYSSTTGKGGAGGNSFLGSGAMGLGVDQAGDNGAGYGSGGSGGHAASTTDRVGGTGAPGLLVFLEFIGG
jgi:hypothetical protein